MSGGVRGRTSLRWEMARGESTNEERSGELRSEATRRARRVRRRGEARHQRTSVFPSGARRTPSEARLSSSPNEARISLSSEVRISLSSEVRLSSSPSEARLSSSPSEARISLSSEASTPWGRKGRPTSERSERTPLRARCRTRESQQRHRHSFE